MINQFDNSIPKIASRAGDPPTMARQLAQGYLGLQTHGGNDRISYREIQVKEFAPADVPGQHGRAVGHQQQPERHRLHGQAADLQPRHVDRARERDALHALVSLEQDRADPLARARAEPARLRQHHDAGRAEHGNAAPDVARLRDRRSERHVHAVVRRTSARPIYCAANVDAGGATVWKTAAAPEILFAAHADQTASANVPAMLSLSLAGPATFSRVHPGRGRQLRRDHDRERGLDRR